MDSIPRDKIQKIYALGAVAGILESGNKNDNLHILVERVTGKKNVSKLTLSEYSAVVNELHQLVTIKNSEEPPKRKPRSKKPKNSAGMTDAQQGKVWALMYSLQKSDPSDVDIGIRLCGIIKSYLHIDCTPSRPFAWLNVYQGNKLIEAVKGIYDTVKKKTG